MHRLTILFGIVLLVESTCLAQRRVIVRLSSRDSVVSSLESMGAIDAGGDDAIVASAVKEIAAGIREPKKPVGLAAQFVANELTQEGLAARMAGRSAALAIDVMGVSP